MATRSGENAGSSFYSKYVLVILLAVYVSNQWCRYLLNYLYAVSDNDYDDDDEKDFISIADATGISESDYGLLVGYGFSFFYVIFGLFMGRAADIYDRRKIVFYGVIIWNLALVLMGMSNNFWQLLLTRILLGIGESFSMPASYSLIADYFPSETRAQANGIFAFGVYVGGGLSSLSIAMATGIGWRGSCYAVALYGFLLAVLVRFTVREPQRSSAGTQNAETVASSKLEDEEEEYTMIQSFGLIYRQPLLIMLFFGSMVRFMAGFAIGSYLPSFYANIYPEYNTVYSYLNASVVSVGGALSSYLGGRISDRWERSGEGRARLYVPAIGAFLGAPTIALVLLVPGFYSSMFFLFVEYLVAESWFGPAISVLQNALPPRARGVGVGTYSFLTTVAGSFITYLLGVILDIYTSDEALTTVLLITTVSCYILSSFIFYLASRHMEGGPAVPGARFQGKEETRPLLAKAIGDGDGLEPYGIDVINEAGTGVSGSNSVTRRWGTGSSSS